MLILIHVFQAACFITKYLLSRCLRNCLQYDLPCKLGFIKHRHIRSGMKIALAEKLCGFNSNWNLEGIHFSLVQTPPKRSVYSITSHSLLPLYRTPLVFVCISCTLHLYNIHSWHGTPNVLVLLLFLHALCKQKLVFGLNRDQFDCFFPMCMYRLSQQL